MNASEAAALLGKRPAGWRATRRACATLLHRGPQAVLLSLGGAGAVLATSSPAMMWAAAAPRVRVRSTVGAGDALLAGFLSARVRGGSPEEALRLGVACGSAAVLTPGAEWCRRRDVARLFARVRVRSVA